MRSTVVKGDEIEHGGADGRANRDSLDRGGGQCSADVPWKSERGRPEGRLRGSIYVTHTAATARKWQQTRTKRFASNEKIDIRIPSPTRGQEHLEGCRCRLHDCYFVMFDDIQQTERVFLTCLVGKNKDPTSK